MAVEPVAPDPLTGLTRAEFDAFYDTALTGPTDITVDITGLEPGESAELWICPRRACSEPRPQPPAPVIPIVSSGTGEDSATFLATEATVVELHLDDFWSSTTQVRFVDPNARPPTLSVEPASVPEPGTYTFTVTGTGWTSAPPIFVLPCFGDDIPAQCDTGNLTPATPEDGVFTVEVEYTVDPDGLVIAAGDAAQTETASVAVSIAQVG